MQELLIISGKPAEPPQDATKQTRLITTQVMYLVPDYDPSWLVTTQVLYLVPDEEL